MFDKTEDETAAHRFVMFAVEFIANGDEKLLESFTGGVHTINIRLRLLSFFFITVSHFQLNTFVISLENDKY